MRDKISEELHNSSQFIHANTGALAAVFAHILIEIFIILEQYFKHNLF